MAFIFTPGCSKLLMPPSIELDALSRIASHIHVTLDGREQHANGELQSVVAAPKRWEVAMRCELEVTRPDEGFCRRYCEEVVASLGPADSALSGLDRLDESFL
jgi:hypothetical protein